MTAVLILLLAQAPPDVVVEKKKEQVCNTVHMTGSRLRTVRRCTKPKPDPQEKIDDLEAQRAIDYMLQQQRFDHSACVQSRQPKC